MNFKNPSIYLILDDSGSMQEWGKMQASLYLARTLKQSCDLLGCTCEILRLKDASSLTPSILISDGLFEKPNFKVCACLAVGVDANKEHLVQISRACYEPEHALNALHHVLLEAGLLA
ncbi:hypothetical protein ACFOPX_07195 [Helicobacter baculiformis]|uniref:VWFA domain-containing protein n=1 Tax=Helicobacter baculiformis TaxID=427351 RepID=A0ABV7ZLC8_9HELI|nr:hypothetical protein [Helicobacter baculiformis]